MMQTPKSLRLHVGIFGRTNVGKSSFLNMVSGQDVAITSPVPGTTTDAVEKTMEILPVGPVLLIDSAGLGDKSPLGHRRLPRTKKIFERADVMVLVTEPAVWTEHEDAIAAEAKARNVPLIVAVNKTDIEPPAGWLLDKARQCAAAVFECSCVNPAFRGEYAERFKRAVISCCPESFLVSPPLIGDLVPAGGTAVFVVPIDLQAPKGRLILPQVQALRDLLDNDASGIVVKEREYRQLLNKLNVKPDIAVCDSQVVLKMIADTPPDVKCTTFSILFARLKGDLNIMAKNAAAIAALKSGDKVLIAEACSHHAAEDDIGRVKIPRWLRQYTGAELNIETACGRDFPADLSGYKLIINCGACMHTRREMLWRIAKAQEAGVPITNYGLAIAFLQGVLERVLSPFPAALAAYKSAKKSYATAK